MKRICFAALFATLIWPFAVHADDVIPSVSKEEMGAYKSAFGKAIAESRRAEGQKAEAPGIDTQMSDPGSAKNDNFARKVSDAARNLKTDVQKDNKNFGAWVSKQRSQRPDDSGASSKGSSDAAKASTAAGRPNEKGKSEEAKKKGHGKNP